MTVLWWTLAAAQFLALGVLLARLAPGRTRRPPVLPVAGSGGAATVSILVATLNEAGRIGPCLEGLTRQGALVREILIIDSNSSDGTREQVTAASRIDPRIRLLTDPPLPADWVGKVWALQHGLSHAAGDWVLGLDADITPHAGLSDGVVAAAQALGYDVCSFSPRFAIASAAEQWVQPALLVTLVYRCGAVGAEAPPPARVLANGQCFLAKRAVLEAHGGYALAATSLADDVTLARALARRGVRVGFLDGSALYAVRSYTSMREAWREWGRSLDLKDATTLARQWADVVMLALAQALPIPALAALAFPEVRATIGAPASWALLGVNALLLAVRFSLLAALRGSYERPAWTFWLSPLADPAAVARILISTLRRRRVWRGRSYR